MKKIALILAVLFAGCGKPDLIQVAFESDSFMIFVDKDMILMSNAPKNITDKRVVNLPEGARVLVEWNGKYCKVYNNGRLVRNETQTKTFYHIVTE